MIDLNATNEWQHRDPETGLVLPWYVKSFLLDLITWDLKERKVLELGGGSSSLWWNKKAGEVLTVEASREWAEAIAAKGVTVAIAEFKELFIQWASGMPNYYDIAIIDCEPIEWRDLCIAPALRTLKPGGHLIFDNWMQPSVGWLPSEETQRLVTSLPHVIYSQAGHPDWKTLVATKP
jgi:predicted O-methyltransferase YrrM